jgi:hypothetical protein
LSGVTISISSGRITNSASSLLFVNFLIKALLSHKIVLLSKLNLSSLIQFALKKLALPIKLATQ